MQISGSIEREIIIQIETINYQLSYFTEAGLYWVNLQLSFGCTAEEERRQRWYGIQGVGCILGCLVRKNQKDLRGEGADV